MDRPRRILTTAARRLPHRPVARLVLASIAWAVVVVLLAFFAGADIWLGFVLGALLPASLWVAWEGFWVPTPSRLDLFLAMTASEFEHAVAAMMVPLGYTDVRVVAGHDDHGVDVLCRDRRGDLVAIQCKKYKRGSAVNASQVQTFLGGMQIHQASRGIIVTTASFSGPAREIAARQDIRLVDGEGLARFIADAPS